MLDTHNPFEQTRYVPSHPITERKKTISLSEAMEAVKDGKLDTLASQFLHSFNIEGDDRRAFIDQLSKREGVTTAFAERFLDDEPFRKRVMNICNNFAKHGERLIRLEEAEIYTEVMDPDKKDDIIPLLESTDPTKRFKGSESLPQSKLIAKRLLEMRNSVLAIDDKAMVHQITAMMQSAMEPLGLGDISDDASWYRLAESPELLSIFQKNADIRNLYEQATEGQLLNQIGRQIQLYRREHKDGSIVPTLSVDQIAKNAETGDESRLGFTIEKKQDKRIMKDVFVVIDKNTRNTNEGMKFLLDNLELVKKYSIDEAEFVANIKIGSYVWARISDMDIDSMKESLSPRTLAGLGPNPDPKRLKGKILEELILPTFEQNLGVAARMAMSGQNPEESQALKTYLMEEILGKALTELRAKALSGEATMEDFSRLGADRDLIYFNKDGELVERDSPDATTTGHLGQAAIMGIPWKARLKMDRANIFRLIDKLDKSKGLTALLKRTNQKIGLALSI